MMISLVVLAFVVGQAHGSAHGGASVQLFEWSWADVANECEKFLGPKGFKAVQVSPPQDHIQGWQWWTRYQPVQYSLTSRSGNEAQFKDMVSRCRASNVTVIVDAVINHMAAGSGVSVGGAAYGNRQYPFYSPNDFHHDANNVYTNCPVVNYNDKFNVQFCDLVGLPDLLTSSSYVQGQIASYLNKLYSYGVRGIRIDAAKHQDAGELSMITRQLPADMFVGQEVIGAAGEAVQPSMYFGIGQVSEFFYADYLDDNVIPEGKMGYLQTLGEAWGLMPDQYADVFLDNHDTQRNGRAKLTYKNGNLYTFANLCMLAWPYGNVRIMSSYDFPTSNTDQGPPSVGVNNGANCNGKDWVCEHRWTPIASMVGWRNAAGTADMTNWQQGNGNQVAFSRGGRAFIAFNRGSSTWSATLRSGLSAGKYCNVIKDGCEVIEVYGDGTVNVSVPPLSAVALHVNAKQ